MSVAVAEEPRVVHSLRGRLRLHLPGWSSGAEQAIETRLRRGRGIMGVQANALTGNVLVCYDPAKTTEGAILASMRALGDLHVAASDYAPAPVAALTQPPKALREGRGPVKRTRIAVRGLDRDPDLARRVVARLESLPGVHQARANPLTGRVLVEYAEHRVDIEELVSAVTKIELPALDLEDRPSHPLDPAPLIQSATRTVGAGLGLSLLAGRQLAGMQGAPLPAAGPATAAGIIGILQGYPATRNGLRRLLGRHLADLLFQGAAIVSLALAGSPLGLTLTGAEALRLLTEVVARRAAFRRFEETLTETTTAPPGAVVRLESGEYTPRAATVLEGTGTGAGRDGLPVPLRPGETISAGARIYGGPFVLELQGDKPFEPEPRPAPVAPSLYDRYQQALGPASLGYAALTALLTRSPSRTFAALLLVNPRTAIIGAESADLGASARVLRAGVTIIGTRPQRSIRRSDALLLDGPRLLSDGFELTGVTPLTEDGDAAELLPLAVGVAAAAGWPWGNAFRGTTHAPMTDGAFDGHTASALLDGVRYTLGPPDRGDYPATATGPRRPGHHVLLLRREGREGMDGALGLLALRVRLAQGVDELVTTCRRHGVELAMLPHGAASGAIARRTGIAMLARNDALEAIRERQSRGQVVAFASDSAHAAPAFAACDLAIGLVPGRSYLPARADLLAPDLGAIAAIIEAGARRKESARDAIALSLAANAFGAVWGLRGAPGIERAASAVYVTALGAMADGWLRLRGGERPRSILARLHDPQPERWGRQEVAAVLRTLDASELGLSSEQAAERRTKAAPLARRNGLLPALLDQLRSPLTLTLAAAAGVSLVLGSPLDVVIISATIAVNVAVGIWQESRAGRTAEALERLGTASARLLRDGRVVTLPAPEIVPGDVLLLAPGDRVAADARLLSTRGLEVDEAALTGESLPVTKDAAGPGEDGRIVMEGSDVTAGTGRAVVVAVGRQTRLGATAAALALDETERGALGQRLHRLMRQVFPLAATGGALVTAAGLLRRQPLTGQLALGASLAITALPEGLPLLAGVGEAAVARRLAGRQALVRRLASIEALGRVDVACTDKTGTLTEGRLALRVLASLDGETALPGALTPDLRSVLLAAGLASPHPEAQGAAAHPTDAAVIHAAQDAGLGAALRERRAAESPFEPARSFHAAIVGERLYTKGAPEALAARCGYARRAGGDQPLDAAGQQGLLAQARNLAARGLRILMVAEGASDAAVADPHNLVALGFVGLSDPLRADVPAAVRRCREAGVRVMMLTGDHPVTARAIAREAGLLDDGHDVLSAVELAELENGDLDRRLARAAVVARATPLDKLRIVESLQRQRHVVAMTGDGVNDAPALRLADVGVAMGRGGTEVARQAADVVLADDDFATLVEALVEGRSFWRNIRRALGLLLGGNLGELGLVVGASVLGFGSPLTTRQILAVNLITDALPALAVALQRPEDRNLAGLAREGEAALDAPLRRDVLRRAGVTAAPSLAAYLLALGAGGPAQAGSVAFASIVATQLAQTLDAGWSEGSLNRSVLGAVGGSAGVLAAALTVPPLRELLTLAMPGPFGWLLIGCGAVSSVLLNRLLSASNGAGGTLNGTGRSLLALPPPAHQ